ncbi:MAG: hypothetical protein AAGJ85_03015 [Pseudomonadota bacterium]
MNPDSELEAGISVLEPLMTQHDFVFEKRDSGNGSGGPFAQGMFINGIWTLSFSVRFNLGEVLYNAGSSSLDHADYLKALGKSGQYPTFGTSTLKSFEALKEDIANYCSAFLNLDESAFENIIEKAKVKRTGFSALSDYN